MDRLDRARLENSVFPYSCRVVTRFADCDRRGRLHDGAIAALFQEGRSRFVQAAGLVKPAGQNRVIAATHMEYTAALSHPDPVDICTAIVEIGRTSYRYAQLIKQNGRIGAFAEVVQVLRDDKGPVALPEPWRDTLGTLDLIAPDTVRESRSLPVRLNRARLENRAFPHRCELTTRFGDMDRIGHVNNVAIAGLLQEARYRFCQALGLMDAPEREMTLAAARVEYADDLLYPDPVEISTAVFAIGRTSIHLGHVAAQNGHVGVYAEAILVLRDQDGPVQIPEGWRANLKALL